MKNSSDSDALRLNKLLKFESEAESKRKTDNDGGTDEEIMTEIERRGSQKRGIMDTRRCKLTEKGNQSERLTGAAEALLANSKQHSMAVVTVGWFVEVLQTPNMLPILLYILGTKKDR